MSLSLARMRALVRRGLGNLSVNDQYGDNVSIDELLNMSLWELESKFPFKEKECKTTIQTVAGQERYALPTYFDSILSISFIDDTADEVRQYHKLYRSSPANYHDERDVPATGSLTNRGQPTSYYRRGNFLVLDPVPDDVYYVEIIHMKTIEDILEGGKETTGLPQNWDEITWMGAIVRGHYLNQDYALARQAHNFKLGYIYSSVSTKVKDEADSRYAQIIPIDEFPT